MVKGYKELTFRSEFRKNRIAAHYRFRQRRAWEASQSPSATEKPRAITTAAYRP
jgi:hypothetical protein